MQHFIHRIKTKIIEERSDDIEIKTLTGNVKLLTKLSIIPYSTNEALARHSYL